MDLEVQAVAPASPGLFNHPLLVWQGEGAVAPLADDAVVNLRHHLQQGGSLLVDVSDAQADGPFDRSVRRELRRILPEQRLGRVAADHVLYKSFYLLDRHGGRVPTRPYLEGIHLEGRLAVLLSSNDLAGAMAKSAYGDWEYDVGSGGDAVRETSYRLGVNWVMYALCLDYKADQVHLPFILQRRR